MYKLLKLPLKRLPGKYYIYCSYFCGFVLNLRNLMLYNPNLLNPLPKYAEEVIDDILYLFVLECYFGESDKTRYRKHNLEYLYFLLIGLDQYVGYTNEHELVEKLYANIKGFYGKYIDINRGGDFAERAYLYQRINRWKDKELVYSVVSVLKAYLKEQGSSFLHGYEQLQEYKELEQFSGLFLYKYKIRDRFFVWYNPYYSLYEFIMSYILGKNRIRGLYLVYYAGAQVEFQKIVTWKRKDLTGKNNDELNARRSLYLYH